MNRALAGWLDRLEGAAIPALGTSLRLLEQLCEDENTALTPLSEVVQRDPGLTLHLLRTINSLRQKHLHTEVTTVTHALMMMGLSQLKAQTPRLARVEDIESESTRTSLLRTFCRAYHAGYQVWDWARLRHDSEPDELFAAALLHPLAEMLLWLHAPKEMHAIEELAAQRGMDPEEAEYVVLGFGLDQLTLGLAERWGLPMLFEQSLRPENAKSPRILSILLAGRLAREAQFGWNREPTRETVEAVAALLGESLEFTAARVHANAARAARDTVFYHVLPAAALLLTPSVDGNDHCPNRPVRADAAEFCLTPRPDVAGEALRALDAADKTKLGAREIIEHAVGGMHEGAGLNRVVFASLSRDRQKLQASAVTGSENDPLFNRFTVELDEDPLFALLMKRPQSLWLGDDNRHRFWPLVPERFRHTVRTYSFFVISVFVRGKPIGIFYADRHTDACKLDEAAYTRFKQLAAAAGRALERTAG